MAREKIQKFRAWDWLNRRMSFWTMNDLCTWDTKDEKPNALDDWMDFTGLLDKNNIEIYEGDIVEFTYTLGGQKKRFQVRWTNAKFKPTRLSQTNTHEMEVIGNIYQHLDLLNNTLLSV